MEAWRSNARLLLDRLECVGLRDSGAAAGNRREAARATAAEPRHRDCWILRRIVKDSAAKINLSLLCLHNIIFSTTTPQFLDRLLWRAYDWDNTKATHVEEHLTQQELWKKVQLNL